jgi:hypothetical protein
MQVVQSMGAMAVTFMFLDSRLNSLPRSTPPSDTVVLSRTFLPIDGVGGEEGCVNEGTVLVVVIGVVGTLVTFSNPMERKAAVAVATAAALTAVVIAAPAALFAMLEAMDVVMKKMTRCKVSSRVGQGLWCHVGMKQWVSRVLLENYVFIPTPTCSVGLVIEDQVAS